MDHLVCCWVNFGPKRCLCGAREPVVKCQVSGEGIYYLGGLNPLVLLHDPETRLGTLSAPATGLGKAQSC